MNIDINFLGILIGAIMASSVPLILAASGELITERSGAVSYTHLTLPTIYSV